MFGPRKNSQKIDKQESSDIMDDYQSASNYDTKEAIKNKNNNMRISMTRFPSLIS